MTVAPTLPLDEALAEMDPSEPEALMVEVQALARALYRRPPVRDLFTLLAVHALLNCGVGIRDIARLVFHSAAELETVVDRIRLMLTTSNQLIAAAPTHSREMLARRMLAVGDAMLAWETSPCPRFAEIMEELRLPLSRFR